MSNALQSSSQSMGRNDFLMPELFEMSAKKSYRFEQFEKKDIAALADVVAAFYARFLTAEWRENPNAVEFSSQQVIYPTVDEVNKFEEKLSASIQKRFEKQSPWSLIWSLTLSTTPAPTCLLAEACREIKSLERDDLRLLFPAKSALTLHYWRDSRFMKVTWTCPTR